VPKSSPTFRLYKRSRHNTTLARLDRELPLPAHDLLLVGDGSGEAGWNSRIGLGWACVSVERASGMRALTRGAWSGGSIEFGELMAYFQALVHFDQTRGAALGASLGRSISVLVLTDNDVICQQASRGLSGRLIEQATSPLWAGFQFLGRKGYSMQFRYIPRLSIRLNVLCDSLAEKNRKSLETVAEDLDVDLRTLNP